MMKFANNFALAHPENYKLPDIILYDHADIKKFCETPEEYFDAIKYDFVPVLHDDRGKTYYIDKRIAEGT